jgi:hypothetical protein
MTKPDDMAFAMERSFLAQEFLTWLWFKCEVEGGTFVVPQGPIGVAIDDALSLVSWTDDGLKASLRGGSPTGRPEAANALAAGLMLKRARLILALDSREWQFSLDADTLDLLGVKTVDPDADDEPEDALADKLAAGEQLREIVDSLYELFLALRLSEDWDRIEVPRLKSWVKKKLTHAWELVGAA